MAPHDPALDAHVNSNWGNAERLLEFLSDRRLLTDTNRSEDARFCVQSAIEIRSTMSVLMAASTAGPLKVALREIQVTCREFVTAAGPHGRNFEQSAMLFRTNLLGLRLAVARQVDAVASLFDLDPSPEMQELLQLIEHGRRH